MLTDSDFDPDLRLKLANRLLFPKFCPTAVHSLARHGTIRQTRDKGSGLRIAAKMRAYNGASSSLQIRFPRERILCGQ